VVGLVQLEEGTWPERGIGLDVPIGDDRVPRPPEVPIVSRLPLSSRHHDPYWDVDGKNARRSRILRRFARWAKALIVILTLALLATRLPTIDPAVLTGPAGKPILAGAILSILGAAALLAVARIRSVSRH